MNPFNPLSSVEQLAEHIKEEIRTGRLSGNMPGVAKLVNQLGVGTKTVVAAMALLENEGILLPQGMRRGRRIVMADGLGVSSLRIQILLYNKSDALSFYNVELLQKLLKEGHIASFAPKCLDDFGMDMDKFHRFVQKIPADAWVIFSGSLEVLKWFSEQNVPAFAFAGRRRSVRISSSGPDKIPAILDITRRLVQLGHRRIVLLARELRRKPYPGQFEQTFLNELVNHGIPIGDYNLPNWEATKEGLHTFINNLFLHTPPTALIIEEPSTFIAVQNHLAQKGILAPRDVSLICDDPDSAFDWCLPSVAHIAWDPSHSIQRIVRWANGIARGKNSLRHSFTKAEFVEGGTIGPAPKQIESRSERQG